MQPVALTSRTVTDKAEIRRLILKARDEGYATTVDQLDYGITALAVPIRAVDGRIVAALNSSGYTGMVTPDDLVTTRLPDLRAAAARLSAATARIPALSAIFDSR
jgi:IclR family pca regulon transcriptional regulator